ncbi:unnamed protein product, partial [Rotaria sordida]
KRLRCITALGLRNLTVNDFNFTVHFTLHRNEKTVAFYTSELVENQRSPEWFYLKFPISVQCLQVTIKPIDGRTSTDNTIIQIRDDLMLVARKPNFVMRVWITSSENCRLFLEYDVHLDNSLVPDEQKDDSKRSNNSLWLEMFGYQFTDNESILDNQTNIQLNVTGSTIIDKKSKRIHLVKSYNKLSILRMINVIDAIRAENRSSIQCLERLQTFVNAHEDHLSKIKERESRQLRIENLRQRLQSQTLLYEQRFNANQEKQKIIQERKNQLERNLLQLVHKQEELNSYINHLNQSKCLLHDLIQVITYRQKDIINEIYRYVYPIVNDKNDEYLIGNIKLPPAEDKIYHTSFTRERENEIEAAIGYCAHFVFIISQFIQLPLRFPIECYGTSPIKIYDYTLQPSDFTLYPNNDTNTFQYGLFLLNRDIGQIMYHCHLGGRHIDYRKTLKNLKDLVEQYFTNANNHNQIQFYTSNQQLIETTIPSNSYCVERRLILNKQNSIDNSSFSLSLSTASSSIIDSDQNDDSNNVDLFPTSNTISPRLTMQFSHQQ